MTTNRKKSQWLAAWIYGSILLSFLLGVFTFGPESLPEYKHRILAITSALACGLVGFFLTGDIGVRIMAVKSSLGKLALKASGGFGIFALVMWFWHSPWTPIKIETEIVQGQEKLGQAINDRANETLAAIEDAKVTTQGDISTSTTEVRATIQEEGRATRAAIENSGLATLETLFSLTARIQRDVDSTIVHLDGQSLQRVYSYDHSMPMILYWGDQVQYYVYEDPSRGRRRSDPFRPAPPAVSGPLFLVVRNGSHGSQHPLKTDHQMGTLLIPGSTPAPMEVFIENPARMTTLNVKILVLSTDRERARERFKEALLSSDLSEAARSRYREISADGLRLRAGPGLDASVLRTIRKGTLVHVIDSHDDWINIRLPEGRRGWVKAEYAVEIQ